MTKNTVVTFANLGEARKRLEEILNKFPQLPKVSLIELSPWMIIGCEATPSAYDKSIFVTLQDSVFFPLTRQHLSWRGLPVTQLAKVLATGVDVFPTDATLFVGWLDKAIEYGGDRDEPRIAVGYHPLHLLRTFEKVPVNTDNVRLEE